MADPNSEETIENPGTAGLGSLPLEEGSLPVEGGPLPVEVSTSQPTQAILHGNQEQPTIGSLPDVGSLPMEFTTTQTTQTTRNVPREGYIEARLDPLLLHILQDIVCLSPTSIIYYLDEVEDLLDLITMREADIAQIEDKIGGNNVKISKRDS